MAAKLAVFRFAFFCLVFSIFTIMYHGRSRTHEQCRGLICSACGVKDLKCTLVSDTIQLIIKEEIFKHYDKNDENVPKVTFMHEKQIHVHAKYIHILKQFTRFLINQNLKEKIFPCSFFFSLSLCISFFTVSNWIKEYKMISCLAQINTTDVDALIG